MKKGFEIGPGLQCDVDRLVASRLLIQANSGGGKTRTLRRLLEQSHGRLQHLVIDPEGEYHTLREKFDYVLAAPSGGDTIAHPRTAAMLAERLLQLNVSAILDIYELNPDARVLFVQRFLDALVNAPRNLWHSVLVVLDEAHVYAPEGSQASSATAVKAMASRGRKRGFCLVPATQRLSKLSKDVAAECNNKLIGRCTLDVDIKRAAEELGFTTNEQKQGLRQLEPGQFYAYGPAFDVKAPILVHVGNVKTSHPEPGQKAAPVPAPTDKVRKVLQQLADLPAEAEEREKSLNELKKENADLKRQVKLSRQVQIVPGDTKPTEKIVEKPALTDADRALIEKVTSALAGVQATITDKFSKADAALKRDAESIALVHVETVRRMALNALADVADLLEKASVKKLLEKLHGLAVTPAPQHSRKPGNSEFPNRPTPPARASTPVRPIAPRTPSAGDSNGHLPPGEHAVLTAALTYPDGVERNRLSILTGYKRSSRDAYILRLAQKGLIEVSGQSIVATADGRAAIPDFEPLPTGAALVEYWRQRLPEGERKVLEVLLGDQHGQTARDTIDEVTGYKRSSRDAYLVRLKARGLVEFIGRGTVRASADLMEGR